MGIFVILTHNEPLEKAPSLRLMGDFLGHLISPKYEIADCGAFYDPTFFCTSPKNLLGHFFYSLNDQNQHAL
jgi:hypothetical protein